MTCEEQTRTIQIATFAIISIITISTYAIFNSQLGYKRLLNKYQERYGDLVGYPSRIPRNTESYLSGIPGGLAGHPNNV
jgi:hypothetical protein